MKKQKKHMLLVVLLGCLGAALLGHKVALRMQQYLTQLDAAISEKTRQLEAANEEMRANEVFLAKWQEISGFQDKPVEVIQTEFSSYLQKLATDHDFVFTTLGSPVGRAMDENPEFQVLRYEVAFPADLPDLVEFLASLDSANRLLRIEQLSIARRQISRSDYVYPARRFDLKPPGARTEILSVTMAITIPAAQPPSETTGRQETP